MNVPNDLCPWCEQPVSLADTDPPTRIETVALDSTLLVHPICGAELLHAGIKHKPKRRRSQATFAGTAATVSRPAPPAARRLTLVRGPA